MENEIQIKEECWKNWKNPKMILVLIGMLLIAGVVIVALIREKIVNPNLNQVTVNGEGKISYQPDIAIVNLGVQIDKAATAEEALRLLDEKMKGIIAAVKISGVADENVKTKTFSLYPQYEYKDGASKVFGYGANQQLEVKVQDIDKNSGSLSQVISAANGAGANQILNVNFDISSLNDLKQQARIKAIEDARSKANALAKAAGVKKLKKVVGWYENVVQSPDIQAGYGYGGMEKSLSSSMPAAPQVPSGNQEIIINVGVNYQVD